ncbi:hypothetical protein K505DRAFT_326269 [Melanomma pulvis-pyrius CBS 109.77]|uniref:Uncharacterized protein n=1 Tax=Melanomma pulvis-pyrius CBS 109.77 TaxID=1314802 RepID=A0A6A6X7F1_9PLEO|nr:hypothetical protein K505DRAFT_326269 [Melanomma pulvis-pyrius CBS 109.77]
MSFSNSNSSRRASESSERANKQSHSMKKIWTSVKQHAVEHHRSVNAAYGAFYSPGRYTPKF